MECLKCSHYWDDVKTKCKDCTEKETFTDWYIRTFGKMPPLVIGKEDK